MKNKSNSSLIKAKDIFLTTTSKIFQDIKFAYDKAYKSDQREQIVTDGVGEKSKFKARLANQVAKVKIFWASLSFLPSKILIVYVILVVPFVIFSGAPSGGNGSDISKNVQSSNSYTVKNPKYTALNCNTLNCNDHDQVVNAMREVWVMARSSNRREVKAYEDGCFRGMQEIKNVPNHLRGNRNFYQNYMGACNSVLHYINNN